MRIFGDNYLQLKKPVEKFVIKLLLQEVVSEMEDELIQKIELLSLYQYLAAISDPKRRCFTDRVEEIVLLNTVFDTLNYILLLPFLHS